MDRSQPCRPSDQFCDTTQKLVPSSKYLRVRIWDQSGTLFLEWPLDPEGKLPIGQWSTVTIPFGVLGTRSVSKVALTFVTEQDKLATDQRLTINVDKIAPVTQAADTTAPASPFITDLELSDGHLSANLDATDQESGIGTVHVSLGRMPGANDLVPWTTAREDMTLSLPFVPSGTSPWYVSVKAQNGAGMWSAVTTVDGSAWRSSTRVNSMALEHGSVSPAGTVLIPANGVQTFQATPDFGYVVQDILVDGVSVGAPQTVTVHGDGATHTVIARFAFDKGAWSLDRLPAQVKITLSMPVGSTSYQKNGMAMTLDVPPYLDASSGRTLVPVRAISEGLGADVQWDAATRSVTIDLLELDGPHVVKMTTGAMAYTVDGTSAWMDVAPVITGGRTFVPLRAVSEALGAQVDWNATARTVLIQGVNATSTPLSDGQTLKELYDAAKTWDVNGNGVSDTLEPFLLQQGATSQPPCERTFKRTEVFARMDDTTAASELPALSPVVPIGVHNGLIKVRYSGQLTGYIPMDALEQRRRDLPSVSDTEKWVTASGPSLQAFLNDAVKTQDLGFLTAGQSLILSGSQVTGTNTSSDAFGFETWKMVNVPSGTPNGAFGIQFRITRTMNLLPNPLDTRADILDEPCLYFMGHVSDGNGPWWHDTAAYWLIWSNAGLLMGPVIRVASCQMARCCGPANSTTSAFLTAPEGEP